MPDLNSIIAGLSDPARTEQAIDALSRMFPAPNADEVLQLVSKLQMAPQQNSGTAQGAPPGLPSLPNQSGAAAPGATANAPMSPVFPAQARPVPGGDPTVLAMLQRGLR